MRRPRPQVADALLAIALAVLSLPVAFDQNDGERPLAVVVPLTLLATLPVAVRRRFPMRVFAVTLAAALAMDLLYNSFQLAGALVSAYTVAAHVGRPASVRAAAVVAPAILLLTNFGEGPTNPAANLPAYVLFAAAWLLGDNVRTRRAYLAGLEERAARLERERDESAQRAAAEEQARIARELHDIITHNVSVMTVQAAAAADVFESHPDRAREALSSIESTGREALTELRRLLGSVRTDDSPFAPQPGLARLDALVEQVRATGLEVELTVAGEPRELPPGVDVSAYRIVQEALTNTLKHARASRVAVRVRYLDDSLAIEVVDDGRGAANGTAGRGIVGMRERAALLGGDVHARAVAGGGFAVDARLPPGSRV